MYLIPSVNNYKENEGKFQIKRNTAIVLEHTCDFNDLDAALILQKEIEKELGFKLNITKSFIKKEEKNIIKLTRGTGNRESYTLEVNNNFINISGATEAGVFYGVQTLRQIIRQSGTEISNMTIEDEPHFENRGFYHDITRGKVPTLETLMELVDRAAFYKLNEIQLYIEHTFAFKGMSEVWMDKDPLTSEEILLLDEYCKKRHVDLVPSLSTFGHFYEILKTKSFNDLCELENSQGTKYSLIDRMAHHTLNVTNEGSIKLVENMLNEFIPLFSSNKFNICCDETFDLGKGKSKEKADEVGTGRLYVDFLNKVMNIVKNHNKKVMFWGDVILHYKDLLNEIPEDAICLTWDYNSQANEYATRVISETGRQQYVCPGVDGWSRLMNNMDGALENITRMASYGEKYGAIGVLNTDWGDYGHINLFGNSIPGMAYGASMSWNPKGEKDFNKFYEALSLIEYGDESLELVSLLRDLSKVEGPGWSQAVVWKERYNEDSNLKERLMNIDPKKIEECYNTACMIERKLTKLTSTVKNNKFDLQEFIVSAKGIELMNAFYLVLSKDEFNNENAVPVYTGVELAEELEVWFSDYAKVWRQRNKESELYRIREVIAYMCNYLRDAK